MKAKTIKAVLRKKHNNFLASIEDNEIKEIIDQHSIVTGGAIASMLLNEKVNDYDYYFDSAESAKKVAEYYVKQFEVINGKDGVEVQTFVDKDGEDRVKIFIPDLGIVAETAEAFDFVDIDNGQEEFDYSDVSLENDTGEKEISDKKYRPICMTSNAISLSDGIQLIVRFFGDPEKIHENYDFEHCKCYWLPKNNKLELPQKSLLCLLNKELSYTGSKYPLCSIIRTRKFIKRGWQIDAGQFVKMAIQLNGFDLTNPAVLEDQLTGVDIAYFMKVIYDIQDRIAEDPNFVVTPAYLIEIVNRIFN